MQREGYRHLSESSDGSANTKSTQTTSLGNNEKQQLPALMEHDDIDIKYVDEDDDADNDDGVLSDNKSSRCNASLLECIVCTETQEDKSPEQTPPQANSSHTNNERINNSVYIDNDCAVADHNNQNTKELVQSNMNVNSKFSTQTTSTENVGTTEYTCIHSRTMDTINTAQPGTKHNDRESTKLDNIRDSTKMSPDERRAYDQCSTWNNTSPDSYVDIEEDQISNSSKSKDPCIEKFRKRDMYIFDYQSRNNFYKILEDRFQHDKEVMNRKLDNMNTRIMMVTLFFVVLYIILAVPSIVLNIRRNEHHVGIAEIESVVDKHLASANFQDDVRGHVLCSDCVYISKDVAPLFSRDANGACCIRDMATLTLKMKEMFSEDIQTQTSRLANLKSTLSELEQKTNFQTFVINAGEQSALRNTIDMNTLMENIYLKIDSNEKMINSLLERKRSSLHLIGRATGRSIKWQYKAGNIIPQSTSGSATMTISGGTYYVYCTIRYACRFTQPDERVPIGFQIDEVGRRGGPQSLASVQDFCSNGTTPDLDLMLHRIITVPVNQDKRIQLTILQQQYVSSLYKHTFGIFEI